MHFSVGCLFFFCAVIWAVNGARLPVERTHDHLQHLVVRGGALYIGEYPIFMCKRHYKMLGDLQKRAGNMPTMPTTGNNNAATGLGAQKIQTTSGNGPTKMTVGGNQQFGQQKTVQNTTPNKMPQQVDQVKNVANGGNTYGQKPEQTSQMTKPMNNTRTVPGADYYNKQTPTNQKALIKQCDEAIHADNTHQEELLFTNAKYNNVPDYQVATHLAQQCYNFQDKTLPQYSNKKCGDFNNDKTMPKCSGEFYGGRVPGTSGSNSVYTASCEINKVSSPKYFGSISDNERNKLITNVDGDHGKLTSQFLDSQGSKPYSGPQFCQNVPPP